MKAYVGDTVVGEVKLTKDKVIVSNLNITKARDEKVIINLKADVVYTKTVANFSFTMDSIDVFEGAYGMTISAPTAQGSDIVIQGYDIVFKKENIVAKDVLPGTNGVVVFDSTIKVSTDTVIDEIKITPTVTNLTNVLRADSARLLINGEQFDLTDANVTTNGAQFTVSATDMGVGIDANRIAKIQILINTKVPAPMVNASAKFAVEITDAVSADDTSVSYGAINPVNGDIVKIEPGTVKFAASNVAAPATRSLFSYEDQEIGRFSLKAEKDYAIIKKMDLDITRTLSDAELEDMFDGNFTLVNVANNETISADIDLNVASDTLELRNMNYRIEKDQTVNLKLMVNLPQIETTAL